MNNWTISSTGISFFSYIIITAKRLRNPRGISVLAGFTHHRGELPGTGGFHGLGGLGGCGLPGFGGGVDPPGVLGDTHFHFTQYPLCKVYPAPHFGSQRFVAELYT